HESRRCCWSDHRRRIVVLHRRSVSAHPARTRPPSGGTARANPPFIRILKRYPTHMDENRRRDFLKTAGLAFAPLPAAAAPQSERYKLDRIASNTWPIRYIFKSRTGFTRSAKSEEMKKKYGEITMLDFPQFTKDTFPGITHMDLFSGLFGDVSDDS